MGSTTSDGVYNAPWIWIFLLILDSIEMSEPMNTTWASDDQRARPSHHSIMPSPHIPSWPYVTALKIVCA